MPVAVLYFCDLHFFAISLVYCFRGRRGHDRMVVGFTTTYEISAYHHFHCQFESHPDKVYSMQDYEIKFVSDLQQVRGILRVLLFPPFNKTDHHDIAEILLKVALNTINQPGSLFP